MCTTHVVVIHCGVVRSEVHVHVHVRHETLGLSMEIFKYEYNLSRKNIKNNKPIYTLIV